MHGNVPYTLLIYFATVMCFFCAAAVLDFIQDLNLFHELIIGATYFTSFAPA